MKRAESFENPNLHEPTLKVSDSFHKHLKERFDVGHDDMYQQIYASEKRRE